MHYEFILGNDRSEGDDVVLYGVSAGMGCDRPPVLIERDLFGIRFGPWPWRGHIEPGLVTADTRKAVMAALREDQDSGLRDGMRAPVSTGLRLDDLPDALHGGLVWAWRVQASMAAANRAMKRAVMRCLLLTGDLGASG
jgi:hypothetical protein